MGVRVLDGDCLTVLPTLAAGSVQTCVTSPPYYGLRDYGVAGQIGLEATPDAYVARMVAVFAEVRRVLRDDGTLWLNLGDSYAREPGKGGSGTPNGRNVPAMGYTGAKPVPVGLKAKDLIGIPWRVAFALQADGWYLRSEIIWHKPNPMPESVTDRPTKAHEQVFLLSKQERYVYDADAIAEDATCDRVRGPALHPDSASTNGNGGLSRRPLQTTRNARSVWTVATAPYSGAHFATFPPKLIEPCVLAGSAKQACECCGAPWLRVVERTAMVIDRSERTHSKGHTRASGTMLDPPTSRTVGFEPSCKCAGNTGAARSTVLDPFGGAGTTGLVADRLGRDAVLIELNPEYAAMARNRIHSDAPLFTDVA